MQTNTKNNFDAAMGDAQEWAPRLASILDEQIRVCTELDRLSSEQGEQIRGGDTGALLRVLGERQEMVDRLMELNGAFEPFRREWETCMARLPSSEREARQGAMRQLNELVDRIWARDEADRVELEQQRAVVSSELSGLSRGRVAMNAYGARPKAAGPMYQDRSC